MKEKVRRKKEYIFVPARYKDQCKLLKDWETKDPIVKRILYSNEWNYRENYCYIKITFEREFLLISLVSTRAVVFAKSEFLQNKCEAFYKFFPDTKKSYQKNYQKIVDFFYEKLKKSEIDKILKLLELDFLKEQNDYKYRRIFPLISNYTIFRKIFLKKITNKRDLLKEYFKSRYGKIDKLPFTQMEKIFLNIEKYIKYSSSSKDLFFRLLRTSKNAHITINNFQKIVQYPHIQDLSSQAHYLKEKVNYNKSYKALDEIHEDFSKRILDIVKENKNLSSENIYKKEIQPLDNFYLLQSEVDFFEEEKLQNHCIYNYYKKAVNNTRGEHKFFYFSYRKENKIIASLEVLIEEQNYKILQMYGRENSILSENVSTEISQNFEKYYNDFFRDYKI